MAAEHDNRLREIATQIGEAADDPFVDWQLDRVVPVLRSALAPILDKADSADRMAAERDEYAEALMRVAEAGGWQASAGTHLEVRDLRARAERLSADSDRLRERLEIKWAYDGSGNRIPFPEGMEHLDGIECRDETIKGLEEQNTRLSAEVEALRDALKPFADFAELVAREYPGWDHDGFLIARYDDWALHMLPFRAARTALARAAVKAETTGNPQAPER